MEKAGKKLEQEGHTKKLEVVDYVDTSSSASEEEGPHSPKFEVGEKVLVSFDGNLFVATILVVNFEEEVSDWQYKIHYMGWKSRYDEYVRTDRILKCTPDNLELRQKMKDEANANRKTNKKGKAGRPSGADTTGEFESPVPSAQGKYNIVQALAALGSTEAEVEGKKKRASKKKSATFGDGSSQSPAVERHVETPKSVAPPRAASGSTTKAKMAVRKRKLSTREEMIALFGEENDEGMLVDTPKSVIPTLASSSSVPIESKKKSASKKNVSTDERKGSTRKAEKLVETPKSSNGLKDVIPVKIKHEMKVVIERLDNVKAKSGASVEDVHPTKSTDVKKEKVEQTEVKVEVKRPTGNEPSRKYNLLLPPALVKCLKDDWFEVDYKKQLVRIPSRYTVEDFFREFLTEWQGSFEKSRAAEFCNALRKYFNEVLPTSLLYKCEKAHCELFVEMHGSKVGLTTVYPAVHLLRMMYRMPEFMAAYNFDPVWYKDFESYYNIMVLFMEADVQRFFYPSLSNFAFVSSGLRRDDGRMIEDIHLNP